MNHFYIQIELNKNHRTVRYTPYTAKQQINLKELEIIHRRALMNPTGLALIDFFFSAEKYGKFSSEDLELK